MDERKGTKTNSASASCDTQINAPILTEIAEMLHSESQAHHDTALSLHI